MPRHNRTQSNPVIKRMKPIIYLLLAGAALLTACQSSKQTQSATSRLDSLEQALDQATEPLERIALKQQIVGLTIEAATPQERCRIFDDFASLVAQAADMLNERESDYLNRYYEYHLDEEGNLIEPHDSIKQRERNYEQAGLQLEDVGEGIVLITPSPTLFAKYLTLLPAYYQEHWQLLRDGENFAPDACLKLSWRELGDLIARYEAYVKAFPGQTELFGRLSESYQSLQMAYLAGVDNTPIADRSGGLDPDLKAEWQRFRQAYPDSPTTKLIEESLKQKNFDDPPLLIGHVFMAQQSSNYPLYSAYQD